MITFRCPNGHKINSREELVGKSGKCPKCQAPFTVPPVSLAIDPVLSGAGPAPVGQGDPFEFALLEKRDGEGLAPAVTPRPSPPLTAPRGDPAEVVFLCPNGHKLNSPARMIGKPGQCPHCQAKFLVPDPLEISDDEALAAGDSVPAAPVVAPPPRGGRTHERSTAELVEFLWAQKTEEGAVIELHLRDHKIIQPEFYSVRYSTATHGVFGEMETKGTYRLLAISWDAIDRIALRGITRIPADLLESGPAAE